MPEQQEDRMTASFWRMAVAAAAAAAILSGAPVVASAETKLTVMVFQGINNLPLFAAQANGYFAKRSIDFDLRFAQSSDELRNGLAEGRWQIVHTACDNAVAMVEVAKVAAAIVIGGDNGMNSLIGQPDIASVADLRGKTVAVDAPNTAFAFQLYEMLRKNGLGKGDYAVKSVGGTGRRFEAMYEDKTLAATILYPPFSISAVSAGYKDLGEAIKIIGPYQAFSGVVLRSWASANADTLVRYLTAFIEGQRFVLDPRNKAAVVKLIVEHLNASEDVATRSYPAVTSGLAKDAAFDMEGFRNVLALRARFTGKAPQSPETYLDLSYYQKALAAQ
jgi:ABC-type nitrate/sulfonate/bicarbonate transport system substrate-binding protein